MHWWTRSTKRYPSWHLNTSLSPKSSKMANFWPATHHSTILTSINYSSSNMLDDVGKGHPVHIWQNASLGWLCSDGEVYPNIAVQLQPISRIMIIWEGSINLLLWALGVIQTQKQQPFDVTLRQLLGYSFDGRQVVVCEFNWINGNS